MKKLFASLVLATLFLSVTGIGIATNNKAPPNMERVSFVHYAKLTEYSKPTWDDTEDNFKLIMGGVRWFDTISYEVNPDGSGLDPDIVKSTLEASSEAWDSETSFELFAPPNITNESSIGYDGINRIVWSSLDPGIIGVTHLWIIPGAKEIVEFDMEFNTHYTWGNATADPSVMDLQDIATHEFGHNGLDDLRPPKDWALTMYAYSSSGETYKRTLGTGDILGIQELYGV